MKSFGAYTRDYTALIKQGYRQAQTRQEDRAMRLDAHIHVYNEGALAKIKGIVGPLHTTHYVAIMEDNALHLTSHLDEAGAKGIPFQHLILTNVPQGS